MLSYVVLRTLMNMDRNAPLNLTSLGIDDNDDKGGEERDDVDDAGKEAV